MKNLNLVRLSIFVIVCFFTPSLYSQIPISQQNSLKLKYDFWGTKKFYVDGYETNKRTFQSVLKMDQVAYKKYKIGKTYMAAGNIIGSASAVFLIVQLNDFGKGNRKYKHVFYPTVGLYAGSIVLYFIGKSFTKKSVTLYNEGNSYVRLNMDGSSIGLAFEF
jgi:hypothetical protein